MGRFFLVGKLTPVVGTEVIGDESLGKYNKNPKLRIQKMENATKALDFIRKRGVQLTNIGAEDIVDNNVKLLLGLLWTIILRFSIAEISEEGLSAKEGMLLPVFHERNRRTQCQKNALVRRPKVFSSGVKSEPRHMSLISSSRTLPFPGKTVSRFVVSFIAIDQTCLTTGVSTRRTDTGTRHWLLTSLNSIWESPNSLE